MNEIVEAAKALVVNLYALHFADQNAERKGPSSAWFIETEFIVIDEEGQEHSTPPLVHSLN